jgi:hypothetical protein
MNNKTNLFTLLLMIFAVALTGIITYQLTKTKSSNYKAETTVQPVITPDQDSGLTEAEILQLRTDTNNTSTDL